MEEVGSALPLTRPAVARWVMGYREEGRPQPPSLSRIV